MSKSSNIKWIIGLGVAAVLLGAILVVTYQPDGTLGNNSATMSLVHNLVWLVVLIGSAVVHFRSQPGQMIKYAALWIAIGSVIFIGYSLRDDVVNFGAKLKAELIPHQGQAEADRISYRAQKGGHFVIQANVDGTDMRFLVDTGASSTVLSPKDAVRLGFDLNRLSFDQRFRTANGIVKAAPVRLGSVKIGPIELTDVRASVNGAAMNTSLLGMSFLSRIGGYEVIGDKLILRR